ncbi:hypothetical protein DFP72DRAFT_550392 [Ephemerocybe angulata]|uniref:Transmembrane protein n=1 Tax=Ephemerocybe angulata TaxID=980116 RepID=A0A8H6HKW7_9AGAR|nr:hypothetical protein DFP72DRAFT_550392 [Tulosesus angulatus]
MSTSLTSMIPSPVVDASTPTSSTTFVTYTPKAQSPGAAKALKIAIPTVFGVIVFIILAALITNCIRRRQSLSASPSIDDHGAEDAEEGVRPPVYPPGSGSEKVDGKARERVPEAGEDGAHPPTSPTTSKRQSHRRASRPVIDQFEDRPKRHSHRKSKHPRGVQEVQDKIPPP